MANALGVVIPQPDTEFQYEALPALELPSLAEDELAFDTVEEASAPLTAKPAAPTTQTTSNKRPLTEELVQKPDGTVSAYRQPAPASDPIQEFIAVDQGEPERSSDSEGSVEPDDVPSTSGRDDLPWTKASRRVSAPLLRLHNEIVDFCRALAPLPHEVTARTAAVARIAAEVQATWPSAEVQAFGSFVTGLFLPTSDLDLVITNSGCPDVRDGLRALANSLTRKGMVRQMQVIAKAKVPIIKFEEVSSGFNFDISFDVTNGPEAAEFVMQLMQQLPAMRPLVLVLKIFLQQREFNEVYTGGIGSYALLVLVAAFLMLHPSRQEEEGGVMEGSLGVLLLDFFRMFGRVLNMQDVGISCRKGGRYFSKHARSVPFLQPDRPYMLAVEDPKDTTNDLCKGSYQILKIRSAFEYAYQQLGAPASQEESILQRIIRVDKLLVGRPQPAEPEPEPVPTRAAQRASPAQANGHRSKRRRTSDAEAQPSSEDERYNPRPAQPGEDYMDDVFVQPEDAPGSRRKSGRHSRRERGAKRRLSHEDGEYESDDGRHRQKHKHHHKPRHRDRDF